MDTGDQKRHRLLLNLGCGPNALESDWTDLDGSWNLLLSKWPRPFRSIAVSVYKATGGQWHAWPRHAKYLNLLKPFPWCDDCVDAIYASHVWEHLYRDDVTKVTRECFRVLRPGGIMRLVVPDLRYYCEQYLRSWRLGEDSADSLMESLRLRPRGIEKSLVHRVYTFLTDFHGHKWMYDERCLSKLLFDAGFTHVEQKGYLSSLIPEIAQVESPGRVSESSGIAVEGVKPGRR